MSTDTIERIRAGLAVLTPVRVNVVDDSARHAGHAGAASGGGHYQVTVVSTCFEGQSRVARHRIVHNALAHLMPSEIHALGIVAMTPGETAGK